METATLFLVSCQPACGCLLFTYPVKHLQQNTFSSNKHSTVCPCPCCLQCLGLASEVVDMCFKATASRIGGVGFKQLAADVMALHSAAYKVREAGLHKRHHFHH